jgi:hypothetical protein
MESTGSTKTELANRSCKVGWQTEHLDTIYQQCKLRFHESLLACKPEKKSNRGDMEDYAIVEPIGNNAIRPTLS